MRILITGASGLLGLNLALETAHRHTVFGTASQHPIKTDAFTVESPRFSFMCYFLPLLKEVNDQRAEHPTLPLGDE